MMRRGVLKALVGLSFMPLAARLPALPKLGRRVTRVKVDLSAIRDANVLLTSTGAGGLPQVSFRNIPVRVVDLIGPNELLDDIPMVVTACPMPGVCDES